MDSIRCDRVLRWRIAVGFAIALATSLLAIPVLAATQETPRSECRVESVVFEGWQAQQVSNSWVKLVSVPLQSVSVNKVAELEKTIAAPDAVARISIHLIDTQGEDRGKLGAATIVPGDKNS